MKSDSELMNELAKRTNYLRVLKPDESVAMKKALLEIYCDVADLCRKHGLIIMLSGGSCLGAVRHKGFIPWDDDLDVMMPRSDYEKLISLIKEGKLGDKYEYNTPNSSTDSKNVFLKIYRKNSRNIELFNEKTPFPKGLFIDVFAIDSVPKTHFGQLVKGFFANFLQYCSILVLYAQYPSKSLKEFMALDKQTNRRYRIKYQIGKILSIIPHRKWVYWFDKFVASDLPDRQWGIPTGRKYYNGEIFDKNVFIPTTTAEFEGVQVQIPGEYDKYLTNLYKDYMKLPPVEKREQHFIIDFQLPQD